MVFGARGISFRGRHIMDNLRRLLPHTKKESKMDRRESLASINEVSSSYRFSNCVQTVIQVNTETLFTCFRFAK